MGFIVQDFVLHGYPPPPPPPPTYAILTGFVHSGEDHPIDGALVELIHGDDYFSTESNDDGFYRFDELPVCEYVYEVSAEGYEAIRGELRLLPGHNIRHFYLPPLHPPQGCVFGMVWRMIEDDEEPVPGALVLLLYCSSTVSPERIIHPFGKGTPTRKECIASRSFRPATKCHTLYMPGNGSVKRSGREPGTSILPPEKRSGSACRYSLQNHRHSSATCTASSGA